VPLVSESVRMTIAGFHDDSLRVMVTSLGPDNLARMTDNDKAYSLELIDIAKEFLKERGVNV